MGRRHDHLMLGYHANGDEARTLRSMFGPTLAEVTFDDAQSGRGRWSAVHATDTIGAEITTIGPRDPRMRDLREIATLRGQTVRFFLTL